MDIKEDNQVTELKESLKSTLEYLPGFLQFQQEYQPFVGAQVAIRIDGELVFNHAVGFADLDNQEPLTTSHLFRIASHSKTFTAVACMQLVESGKLRLDDRAGDIVTDLAGSPVEGVTVRELLGHGSGFIRDGEDATFWGLEKPFPDRDRLIETIRTEAKILEPMEHFKYSNIGFSLLGLMVESASGQSYRDYVQAHIVDALGLADTGPDLDFGRIDEYARGYTSKIHGHHRREIEHIDTFAESAATGFYATAADLTAFFQAHLDGDDRILSDASKRQMRQVQWAVDPDASYGLGYIITKIGDRTYYGHSGGYPGHITISKLDLERRLSLSVLTNTNDGPAATLAEGILKLIDLALTDKAKTERRDSSVFAPFIGRFAALWRVADVADIGGRLYILTPSVQNPASLATEIEMLNDTDFRIVGDDGWGGYAETMRYVFRDDGTVSEVWMGGGQRVVPIAEFRLPDKLLRPS